MTTIETIFKKLGLTDKDAAVYLSLLSSGPIAIRKLAEKSGINRGTTYEILKTLQKEGLVSYYHKERHQHFVAENPKVLSKILTRKKNEIDEVSKDIENIIPELSILSKGVSDQPVVKFYEDYSGVRSILNDVLDETERIKDKKYVVYSSSTIRPYLYNKNAFPNFTDERIKRKIFVRTIANGPGGETSGKDERKWLTKRESPPTYTLIYAGKVAMISVGENDIPHGLIIEDQAIYKTQLFIFDSLWKSL
ncbi:MAG: transcriptional regulator, TrmB [Candidatus Taylorbacteria bacterium]|nr:transcriptional regulator, TrmB [Candidatus Taylorbacteria bacterium]